MKNIKQRLEEKSHQELVKMAKFKGIKGYENMEREELIEKLLDQYERNVSTTC